MKDLSSYGRYKNIIFQKLDFNFEVGKSLLDIGCGDGTDMEIFSKELGLDVHGMDVYEHPNIKNLGIKFSMGSVLELPFENKSFDYVFLHDVLHHVDEENQSYEKHVQGLKEAKRVVKPGGHIIVVEGNRFNPLFYFHMVKMLGHEHFTQNYFKKIIKDSLDDPQFKFYEAHAYPFGPVSFWELYENIMDKIIPEQFRAYNIAISKVESNE